MTSFRVHTILFTQQLTKPIAAFEPSHQSRFSSSVLPVTVSTSVWSSFNRLRCNITSGTPPARNTRTVG